MTEPTEACETTAILIERYRKGLDESDAPGWMRDDPERLKGWMFHEACRWPEWATELLDALPDRAGTRISIDAYTLRDLVRITASLASELGRFKYGPPEFESPGTFRDGRAGPSPLPAAKPWGDPAALYILTEVESCEAPR